MEALNFVRPGNLFGVGFLIVYGGVPQFSIAWNGERDPERILLWNAQGEGFDINGVSAKEYEILAKDGGYVLSRVAKEAPKKPVVVKTPASDDL